MRSDVDESRFPAPPTVRPSRRWVADHPLPTFFGLTYLLTWCLLPLGLFFAGGPLIAAVIVVSWGGGLAGLRSWGSRIVKWRAPWYFWVAAAGVPILVHAVTGALNVAMGAPAPSWGQFHPWYAIVLVFALRLVNPTDGPIGEELAFRGFALPALLSRFTPLASTMIMAALVTVWHVPLLFVDDLAIQPAELVATVAVTVWYTWLFQRSGGLVLLTVLAHAVEGSLETSTMWNSPADTSREILLYTAAWLTVAILLLVLDRRFWITPQSEPEGNASKRSVGDLGRHTGSGRFDDSVDDLQCFQAVASTADRLDLTADDGGEVLDLVAQRITPLDLDR